MRTLTMAWLFGGGLALVACVRMTTVTGALRDHDRRVLRDYEDGKASRTAARRCHLAVVGAARGVAKGPVLLTTDGARDILDAVDKECYDADVVGGGGNRPKRDLGQGDDMGPPGAKNRDGGRDGDGAGRRDLGPTDGGLR